MEATQKLAAPGTLSHEPTTTAAEVHGEARPAYPPIQQLDGLSATHQPPPLTTAGNAPGASELYSSNTARPYEIGGVAAHPNAGTHPTELQGFNRVPGLSPQTATGYAQAGSSAAEMHASTVRPTELASGQAGDTSWPSELGGVPRRTS